MNKNIGLIALVILALLAGWYFIARDDDGEDNNREVAACTREARVCPDGSTVGRVGPNCEFAECPDGLDSIDLSEFDEK